MLFSLNNTYSQNSSLVDFKSNTFVFRYPLQWKIDTVGSKYSFYYDANLGDITISTYSSRHFSSNEFQEIVLSVNEVKETNPDVQTATSNGIITSIYKYDSDTIKYFIKAFQTEKRMFLISLNWNKDSWETFKDVLLQSFATFKPK